LKLCHVKEIWALALMQGLMFVLFLIQAILPFTNNIGAFCGVVFFEGSLGGLAYVNTFDLVLKTVRPTSTLYSSLRQMKHLVPRGAATSMPAHSQKR
uniref:Battenin n=1 Tax=Hydatigena taeniaeformis TaxID=6205 RepID=A0A0R3WW07_HYDTA